MKVLIEKQHFDLEYEEEGTAMEAMNIECRLKEEF